MAGFRKAFSWSPNFAVLVMVAEFVVSAQAASFVLKWSPQAHTDGLQAFEGIQDDRQQSDPGVKHIYVQGNSYRFDMPLKQRELGKAESERQRNEVYGMVANQTGKGISILKGESWRIQHKIFIPKSLKATTSFTHIMQLLSTLPTLTLSLRHTNNIPAIELHLYNRTAGGSKIIASTPLSPLQEKWIESQITFTAVADGAIQWLLRDAATNTVIVQADGSGELIQMDRVRPKWGIYRSVSDTPHLQNCFMLIKDLQAWRQE
ncbi:hypothetical protein M758_3G122800 [Ceratodon purpureus]|nr:hypothetical protein M758_3G122800 [Ceratodon purpureus]